jgi:predicted MPP superfamily phosphohydrolase
MKLRKISILNVFGFLLLLITTIVLVISLDTKNIYGLDNIKSSSYDSTLLFVDKTYNIIAAGDWYCNEETEKTIQNVLNANPDLIITTGDHVKDVKSADC